MTGPEMIVYISHALNNNAGNENFDWVDEQFYFFINSQVRKLIDARSKPDPQTGTVDGTLASLSDIENLIKVSTLQREGDAEIVSRLYSKSVFKIGTHFRLFNMNSFVISGKSIPVEILSHDKAKQAYNNPYRATERALFGFIQSGEIHVIHPHTDEYIGTDVTLRAPFIENPSVVSSTVSCNLKEVLHDTICDMTIDSLVQQSVKSQQV